MQPISSSMHDARSTGASTAPTDKAGRQVFEAFELAMVLSHFDLGVIHKMQAFPRGSRKAPKLLMKTDRGLYLLKRRARGKDDPYKVAFCHGLQLHLAERQFPLPHLIGTTKDNNSMLRLPTGVYELFEYIQGSGYDQSLEATGESGRILGLFHKLLLDYKPDYEPAAGSYHDAPSVHRSLEVLPDALTRVNPKETAVGQKLAAVLTHAYNNAAKRVESLGLSEWPEQIVHSDWHPGNMLFRGTRVVAVIDYDAARIQQRILDVANGALQFSILGGDDDPRKWPDYPDESRFKRFLRGYDMVPEGVLTRAELRVLPWLMIEALIAEAAIPIAATGTFSRMDGLAFLSMVHRKCRWLESHADALVHVADS